MEGQKLEITSLQQLKHHLNETVPQCMRTGIDPGQYFQLHNTNSTYEENLLHLMSQSLTSSSGRRVQRTINPSCPVNWVVDFQSTRFPPHIWKAVCNGQGTTCLSTQSRQPVCEELPVTWLVLRFLGVRPDGQQVWQWQRESVSVGCTCPDL